MKHKNKTKTGYLVLVDAEDQSSDWLSVTPNTAENLRLHVSDRSMGYDEHTRRYVRMVLGLAEAGLPVYHYETSNGWGYAVRVQVRRGTKARPPRGRSKK